LTRSIKIRRPAWSSVTILTTDTHSPEFSFYFFTSSNFRCRLPFPSPLLLARPARSAAGICPPASVLLDGDDRLRSLLRWRSWVGDLTAPTAGSTCPGSGEGAGGGGALLWSVLLRRRCIAITKLQRRCRTSSGEFLRRGRPRIVELIVATVGGIVEGEHRELLVSPSISLRGSLIFVRGTMTNFTAILSAVVVMISRRLSRMW
jgi:hypothetical protein